MVKIKNGDYEELNKVSKRTANTELTALVDSFKVLVKSGTLGAGVYYETMGQ
jgi:ATP-dependent DNA helicase RecG